MYVGCVERYSRQKEGERERIIRFVRMHLMLQERNGSNGGGKKEGKHHQ